MEELSPGEEMFLWEQEVSRVGICVEGVVAAAGPQLTTNVGQFNCFRSGQEDYGDRLRAPRPLRCLEERSELYLLPLPTISLRATASPQTGPREIVERRTLLAAAFRCRPRPWTVRAKAAAV